MSYSPGTTLSAVSSSSVLLQASSAACSNSEINSLPHNPELEMKSILVLFPSVAAAIANPVE